MNCEIDIETDIDRIRPLKSEVERLYCDNSKILENTSWKPEYKLKAGLIETIDWLKNNLNHYKINNYNV